MAINGLAAVFLTISESVGYIKSTSAILDSFMLKDLAISRPCIISEAELPVIWAPNMYPFLSVIILIKPFFSESVTARSDTPYSDLYILIPRYFFAPLLVSSLNAQPQDL